MRAKLSTVILTAIVIVSTLFITIYKIYACGGCYNYAPNANLSIDADMIFLGDSVTLDGSGSTDDSGISEYCWDFTDNGSYDHCESPPEDGIYIHIYSSAGTFTPRLRVKDDDSCGVGALYDDITNGTVTVQNIIYVDKDATAGNDDGTTWANAFTSLQSAVDAAYAGNEIWVAEGTYTLTSTIDVDVACSIYGGFDTAETQRSERNWRTNTTTIDGNNSVRCLKIYADCTIDGFTITKGSTTSGAGIYNSSCSPTIKNCSITNNIATVGGGGIYNIQSYPLLIGCTISGNKANGSLGDGGGMLNGSSSDPDLINCVFSNNDAKDRGGAILGSSGCYTDLTNCTFYNNIAQNLGGGMYGPCGDITNSIFWGNKDDEGMSMDESAQINNLVTNKCNYSCIQGWTGTYGGTGNIESNPTFVSGLQLGNDSPCIDAGDNSAITESTDIDGNTRKIDDPAIFDSGSGTAPIVDMGAYERTTASVLPNTKISAGYRHTFVLRNNGTVWGCGENDYGKLGIDSTTDQYYLVQVHDGAMQTVKGCLENIVDIAAGDNFSVALDGNGYVWAWGRSNHGQLGQDSSAIRHTPIQVHDGAQTPSGGSDYLEDIVKISAPGNNTGLAGYHALALDNTLENGTSGYVWAWGCNKKGELGDGTQTDRDVPVQVLDGEQTPGGSDSLMNIIDIDVGNDHSIACDSDGNVWTWGLNDDGQLGNGTTNSSTTPVQVHDGEQTPGTSDYLINIVAVEASDGQSGTSYALDSSGNVWAWGNDGQGQLGRGTGPDSSTPVKVLDGEQTPGVSDYLEDIVALAAGSYHILALDENGKVWAWGRGSDGQLGQNSTSERNTPVNVKDSAGTSYLANIVHIDAGYNYSLAVDSSGNAWGWGINTNRQLGLGDTTSDEKLPKLIPPYE